jgi:hypothetical protein
MKYRADPLLKIFEDSGSAFDILTIGVIEEYRNLVIKDNLKFSHLLLKHTVDYYKDKGYNRRTGQILKCNKSGLGFYAKYDADFIQSSVREFGVILDLPIDKVTCRF